ncbi:armadillo-type protein [Exophiala viscosa]|uniref:Armadillo-type protein n=1 Tax=Exophiala viscosa TaxID=2486360 RepID=A0AAN6ID23_9EURO|nr:armadillo-type protein [Exophiala viscosa]
MAPSVHQVAQIFEDAESEPQQRGRRLNHNRTPSAGEALKGRRKETDSPTKLSKQPARETHGSASPLGERHINSPPPPKRVPTKTGDEPLPPQRPAHKKTGSSVSLKGFLRGRERNEGDNIASTEEQVVENKPKKVKSATNLTGLLKRKSKKDLKEEARDRENTAPAQQSPFELPTPIWAQFATQPVRVTDGTMLYPVAQRRTVEEEIRLYTPKDFSEFRPAEQRNFYGYGPATPSSLDHKPPQRPFLEHKSSRSSIFTEELDDEPKPDLKRPRSRDQENKRPESSSSSAARPGLESRSSELSQSSQSPDKKAKRGSRVLEAIQSFNMRSPRKGGAGDGKATAATPVSPQEIDTAFEKVLDSLNIPLNMRDNMRNLKSDVKAGLMRGERVGSGSSTNSAGCDASDIRSSARSPQKKDSESGEAKEGKRSSSRSRPRSRILTFSKREDSLSEKQDRPGSSSRSRSKSRNKSADMTSTRPTSSRAMASTMSLASVNSADSATTPGDFIHYLQEVQKPELVEVSKLHKLRILLRNESISWTDHFVTKGGMDELVQLYYRITKIEWREEHEDSLLHETLLCLKGLCTTSLALQRLQQVEKEFFPALLGMLFDPERKGPAEFSTRAVIVSLLFAHLSAAIDEDHGKLQERVQTVLGFLKDPAPKDDKQPLEFVSQMHLPRPYRVWCKEVVNVTKEVFWIFLHHLNVVPVAQVDESVGYLRAHYPAPRPPHPAAPYVGGVEWEATQYLAIHLDLLNGIIAALPTREARNTLREDLKQSGFEKIMGGSLRTCKEKFYGGVHEGLKCWVSAAKADGWYVEDVRAGPPREAASPRKSPVKKKGDAAPQIALDVGMQQVEMPKVDDVWI